MRIVCIASVRSWRLSITSWSGLAGRFCGHAERREQTPDLLDFVLVNAVAHPWIDPFHNRAAEHLDHASSLVHARKGDMRVDIAAAKESRSTDELAGVVARRTFRPDQAAAQADYPAIAARMPCRILEGEAGTLGKSEQHDALRLKALNAEPAEQSVQHCKCRGQEGLIARDRREERIGIPTAARRLRCQVSKVGLRKNFGK